MCPISYNLKQPWYWWNFWRVPRTCKMFSKREVKKQIAKINKDIERLWWQIKNEVLSEEKKKAEEGQLNEMAVCKTVPEWQVN